MTAIFKEILTKIKKNMSWSFRSI